MELIPVQRLAELDDDERRHQGKRTHTKRRHIYHKWIACPVHHDKCTSGEGSRSDLLFCCMWLVR